MQGNVETELTNVNAWNESDYETIAQFCAKWSKAFNDVLVPILIEEYKNI